MLIELRERWFEPVALGPGSLLVGGRPVADDDLVAGVPGEPVRGAELRAAALAYARLTRDAYLPPLAGLLAAASGRAAALRPLFPLARALGPDGLAEFEALVESLAGSPKLQIQLFDRGWAGLRVRAVSPPADIPLLVAGHLAEVFFFRRDLLQALLAASPRIWLYITSEAFAAHGGVAGGCYRPAEGAIQLALARLYEGFRAPTPGVAPLLHELGHMLDCLDVAATRLGPATGLYPGLRPADGPAFTPRARARFLRGKALEIERYRSRAAGGRESAAPIGHPYVFQSDGEFLAGYLELFFRSPHAVAAQNPDLHAGLVALFGWDPRQAWAEDFPFYIEANRQYYAGGGRPPPDGLSLTP